MKLIRLTMKWALLRIYSFIVTMETHFDESFILAKVQTISSLMVILNGLQIMEL